ncbi:MAG: cytochrome c [Acidobacteriota bacterium]|nr:cytochrome c [Acidobacteriota bacterium]
MIISGAVVLAILGFSVFLAAQNNSSALKLDTGKEIFEAGCAACHGVDGKGAPDSTVAFKKPRTFPDFTQCDQTTPEPNVDWKSTIHDGGKARGFTRIMPSFGAMLTPEQIDKVVIYLRSLCTNDHWPRGEFNLPRAFATEKAFLEDETVLSSSFNVRGAPGITNDIIYEKRFGMRNQFEFDAPINLVRQQPGQWFSGFGDVSMGVKHVLFANLNKGSILSAQGGIILPTGNKSRGLGTGVTTFEVFGSFGQILPSETFIQAQAGTLQPTDPDRHPRSAYWRVAVGKQLRQSSGYGRLWTPMVEFVADRDFATGAKTHWDVIPEFQVTLSARQHVRFNTGLRIPASNTAGRSTQVIFYILWDRFDGTLFEGWR